jgi:hypothetical protein
MEQPINQILQKLYNKTEGGNASWVEAGTPNAFIYKLKTGAFYIELLDGDPDNIELYLSQNRFLFSGMDTNGNRLFSKVIEYSNNYESGELCTKLFASITNNYLRNNPDIQRLLDEL